jgi:hypothetical protein
MPDEMVYVLLWNDEDGPQCALYTDKFDAAIAAGLVGGRVERRAVHTPIERREPRFARLA